MEIRFISTLTADDENLFAPALLKAFGALLDKLPISYTIRIETTGAEIFHYSHTGADASGEGDADIGARIAEALGSSHPHRNGSAA